MAKEKKNMGLVVAVCVGERQGHPKQPVAHALVEENWGIAQDSHAGIWPRQVSLLADENLETFRLKAQNPQKIESGTFGANIITRGLEFSTLQLGDHLEIGEIVLEITIIGWNFARTGSLGRRAASGLRSLEGILARVVRSGEIAPGTVIVASRGSITTSRQTHTTPAGLSHLH